LLLLRDGNTLSAVELARRFEVSPRTIYRDIESLNEVGVPVYAEMGRHGGFRLVEGYFLPPIMFSRGEAISLLLGLTLLHRLRSRPFAAELETSERKLLAAVPDQLQRTLSRARQIIGFENIPKDVFHPEPAPELPVERPATPGEGEVVELFLQAILDRRSVRLDYHSPYGSKMTGLEVSPCGLLWDRDHWYLVGKRQPDDEQPRLWRTDRVTSIRAGMATIELCESFDVTSLLDHAWLSSAMEQWRKESPVEIAILPGHAQRLQQDWYYRHAHFEPLADGRILMIFGEDKQENVFELIRWLGHGAELVSPPEWRSLFRNQLVDMLAVYIGEIGEQAFYE
jgi:predicted DNA-binding transcriptional regulator YafY